MVLKHLYLTTNNNLDFDLVITENRNEQNDLRKIYYYYLTIRTAFVQNS